jgi:DNA-binding response OmpR family regulator
VRILVVEDEPSLAEVLTEGLRDQAMAVDVAHDGLTAAAKLDLNGYDVVVLDRDLPGIHGDTLCQMITERDDRAMVLMLTAAGSPGDRVSGLTLGADDYLAKPFHFPELVLRIRALARRRPSARARTLRAAGVELDPARRPATVDSSTSRSRSSHSWKPSCVPAPPLSAPRSSSNRSGTRTSTRSPTPFP